MAAVYHARQVLLDRDVALKVMSPQLAQDSAYAQRFLQEARMLASLNHPHVVPVYDIGVTPEGLNYFSMQLLNGGDFADRLREGISEEELVRVLVAVAQALGFAHARGYVHRDVTPANIMFDSHGVPVLTDFGIARALSSTSRITSTGLSIGTSHYMSPEQARGVEVDGRSDIYSLGVVTYEALVGKPPFDGDDGFAVAFAHVHDPVPRLPEEVARWQPLIDRALAKNSADRFPDCQAFIDGIRAVAPEEFRVVGAVMAPVATAAAARSAAAKPRGKPLPWLLIGLGLGAIASGVVLAMGIWSWLQKPSAAPPKVAAKPAQVIPAVTQSVPPAVAGTDAAAVGVPEPTDAAVAEVAETAAGEPLPEHTVIDPVVALIGMGQANIRLQQWTTPPIRNAVERFQMALMIEPGNKAAEEGIAQVAKAYLDRAAATDPDAGGSWWDDLQQAERVAALTPAGRTVTAAAQQARKARAAVLLERGRDALAAWQAADAEAWFDQVLRLQPDDKAGREGLAEARQLGKPGYRFADALSGGGKGPPLVVVEPGYALGVFELRVSDFKRYWQAAGQRQFGADMPSCNNREGAAFFSNSKKRTWLAPDIKQNDNHPAVCVNVPMAEAYLAWLSEQSGRQYRLPKLTELRMAKLGGCTENVRDATFKAAEKGSGEFNCNDGYAETAPVGQFAAHGVGLHDTAANVREWTADCPGGNCKRRLAAGLSWESKASDEARKDFQADTGFNTIGFRVLRVID